MSKATRTIEGTIYACKYPKLARIFYDTDKTFNDFMKSVEYKSYIKYVHLLNRRFNLLNISEQYSCNNKIMILYYTREHQLFVKRLVEYHKLCVKYKLI